MNKQSRSLSGAVPRFLIAIVALLSSWTVANAQHEVAVKTNLLYDATATINLGAEIPLAQKWSFDLSANFNGWSINDHLWKHWLLQPEARYWLCDRFSGHFFAMHLLGGQYNFGNNPQLPGQRLPHARGYPRTGMVRRCRHRLRLHMAAIAPLEH